MIRAAAVAFLRHALAAGPRPAAELERRAIAQGISSRTLDRARKQLGVQACRQDGHWVWALPAPGERKDATVPPPDAEAAPKDATVAPPTPTPRQIEDLRPGELIEWNGRAWPFLGIGYRDGVPLAYFTCPEAAGGIGCQPVWSVRPAKDAKP